MKINEIAFVCYAITDVPKARAFYEGVLGLTAGQVWESPDMAFIEYYMGEHTLAIGKGSSNFVVGKAGGTVALEVDNFDEAIKNLKDNKIVFLMEALETGGCHMALIEDPDGNQLMIHKRKLK